MSPAELASAYIQAFCDADIEALEDILAENLHFLGPVYSFYSRDAFLAALTENPPEKSDHRVITVTEGAASAAVFWEYQKPDVSLIMAQYFETAGDRIREILLVFDSKGAIPHQGKEAHRGEEG